MPVRDFEESFEKFCKKKKFEINKKQFEILKSLQKFFFQKKKLINIFSKKSSKSCYYLYGKVGVGKTLILDHVFQKLDLKKKRSHFNKFMIEFHNFRHKKKGVNPITAFVKDFKKKYKLLYLDEFQVTNIVDAMILGKLFEEIFDENIKVILSSNTKPNELYKDGLQRDQFLPFIKLIEKESIQKELKLNNDYRKNVDKKKQRIFYPLNEKTLFSINQLFRRLTRDMDKSEKTFITKGRKFYIHNFYKGISKFTFEELCDKNLGSEDYFNLANICHHIFIYNVPSFTELNSNQQLRFINLIDVLYDRKIKLTLSLETRLENLSSSKRHFDFFKRTISRLHEMTKVKNY